MIINRYLIIGSKKKNNWSKLRNKPTTRLTANPPQLKSHEVAIQFTLDVPEALFEKPLLKAKISISKDAVSSPVIEAETVDNIEEIISQNLGIDLNLFIVDQTESEENGY